LRIVAIDRTRPRRRTSQPRAPRHARFAAASVATLALCLTLCLVLAAGARADVGATIIERCTAGQSLSGFSQQAYSKALQEMPAEVNEYSDCANLIRKAELAAAGRGGAGGGPGGGGSIAANVAPPTPAEQQTLTHAKRFPPASVQVDGETVNPGVVHADIASAFSTLPTPLLALLAFLATCVALLAGRAIRKRVDGRSRHAS
jgi:hypothetical protein